MRKARPDWQAGRLNGPGGKIKPGESVEQAAVREFAEETYVHTTEKDWRRRVLLHGKDWSVYFVAADRSEVGLAADPAVRRDGDEPCGWYSADHLPAEVIPNLRWIVPLCLDPDVAFEVAVEDGSVPAVNGATIRGH